MVAVKVPERLALRASEVLGTSVTAVDGVASGVVTVRFALDAVNHGSEMPLSDGLNYEATFFGLLGSVGVGVTLMDLPLPEYFERTRSALGLDHALMGLIKGAAFGFVVGLSACYHGLRSGRGPQAIGGAVKKAVVYAIIWVVVVDAVLTAFFKWAQY